VLEDNINFIKAGVLPEILKIFGWELKDNLMVHNGLAVVRADFYPLGHVFAYSSKALIICDGEMCIKYRGKEYSTFGQLIEEYGHNAFETFPEWEIKVEKQWAIMRSGKWVTAFTNLAEMPYRKTVRC
jgi:hypothetical protein